MCSPPWVCLLRFLDSYIFLWCVSRFHFDLILCHPLNLSHLVFSLTHITYSLIKVPVLVFPIKWALPIWFDVSGLSSLAFSCLHSYSYQSHSMPNWWHKLSLFSKSSSFSFFFLHPSLSSEHAHSCPFLRFWTISSSSARLSVFLSLFSSVIVLSRPKSVSVRIASRWV